MRKILHIILAAAAALTACSHDSDYTLPSGVKHVQGGAILQPATSSSAHQKLLSGIDTVNLPAGAQMTYRLKTNGVGKSLRLEFNDSNDLHITAAEKIGITPITSLREAYFTSKPLVRVETCEDFVVDSLTHSMPFLVPKAAELLHTIGKNFNDSVQKRGGKGVRMKVTSLLRTDRNVKKLRRRNRNSTDSSAHRYATTFDITYSKFAYDDSTRIAHQGDLKNILGEVLKDLRDEGKCFVKYEYRQPCYHITTR